MYCPPRSLVSVESLYRDQVFSKVISSLRHYVNENRIVLITTLQERSPSLLLYQVRPDVVEADHTMLLWLFRTRKLTLWFVCDLIPSSCQFITPDGFLGLLVLRFVKLKSGPSQRRENFPHGFRRNRFPAVHEFKIIAQLWTNTAKGFDRDRNKINTL